MQDSLLQHVWVILLSGGPIMVPLGLLCLILYRDIIGLFLFVKNVPLDKLIAEEEHHREANLDGSSSPGDRNRGVEDTINIDEIRLRFHRIVESRLRYSNALLVAAASLRSLGNCHGDVTYFSWAGPASRARDGQHGCGWCRESAYYYPVGSHDRDPGTLRHAVGSPHIPKARAATVGTESWNFENTDRRECMLRDVMRDEPDESVEINLSPMIDCIFILLIFFIVTTAFVQEIGIEVNKPEAASAVPLEKDSILIGISADEKIYWGGQEIGLSGVRPTVQRILLAEDASVIIKADRDASHGIFSQVYGEAKAAGARRIHFSTETEGERRL